VATGEGNVGTGVRVCDGVCDAWESLEKVWDRRQEG